jgi:spermidine synthase
MKKDFLCFSANKWFFEGDVPYDNSRTRIGIEVKKKLYSGKSPYQKIDVFDTYCFGRILVLDGVLQTSEEDEFIYHEMLCQTPLFLHPNPKKVLIIGGGDGGSLEEVLKHKVEDVQMIEIDKKVIEVSKKYLPLVSKGVFDNKKAKIIIDDGKEYVKRNVNFFDIIILDLSDPGGPSKDLISSKFYKNIEKALKKDGIVSIQSGSFSCQPKLVSIIFNRINKIFPWVEIRRAVVPSYQAGEYSFIIGSKNNLDKITLKNLEAKFKKTKLSLSYYSPKIHFSSLVLPRYLKEKILMPERVKCN